ncbi:basic salivary proline-rich protein 1-like [Homarus americanus]|uniref:basic salivary proline-rich protein 1-like n=1 Tax=Homarus americanus TaxID=6706 RepID=UPI001C449D75|nr:basic salivary proline-rich protein 1-like [Homarus americanus]
MILGAIPGTGAPPGAFSGKAESHRAPPEPTFHGLSRGGNAPQQDPRRGGNTPKRTITGRQRPIGPARGTLVNPRGPHSAPAMILGACRDEGAPPEYVPGTWCSRGPFQRGGAPSGAFRGGGSPGLLDGNAPRDRRRDGNAPREPHRDGGAPLGPVRGTGDPSGPHRNRNDPWGISRDEGASSAAVHGNTLRAPKSV